MKRRNIFLVLLTATLTIFVRCENYLDTGVDTFETPETIETNYGTLWRAANSFYTPLQYGFTAIDDNLFAAASDEAVQTRAVSNVAYFNKGTINSYVNPKSGLYQNYYEGIRAALFFLDYAEDGEDFLALGRDTSRVVSPQNYENYQKDIRSLNWYRAEANVAQAYYYGELIKMYGGVPIVKTTMDKDPDVGQTPRSSYDDVVEYIVELIDSELNNVQENWATHPDNVGTYAGRFDKAAAMAIKSRVLLYAASPRNNPTGDIEKWKRAAEAAHDLIEFKHYTMPVNRDYGAYFEGIGALNNDESIYLVRKSAMNSPEVQNYPITTPGGNSGITPSHNLVSAYEYIGTPDQSNPYANRDPRLGASIVVNGSFWNNRIIDQSPGGEDDMTLANTSRTGYYLKKFLTDNLNLTQGATAQHLWPLFRYAEVLLNYAEAMNEAYGPDAVPAGFTLSAKDALMEVRNSASTQLPAVTATGKDGFREAVKHERRIELAFEDHRYWDLVRWNDAEEVLSTPIEGVKVSGEQGAFSYQVVDVDNRVFQQRNYYWPFTRAEIENSNGSLEQNPGY
jgi:hypothetical protein